MSRPDARALLIAATIGAALFKGALALRLPPFGDEAFYWQESRALAWGYSEIPPLTPWLIRLGGELAGDGLLGLRVVALLLGLALPWLVVAWSRRLVPAREAHLAGLLSLALPLGLLAGVVALPDVPLTAAILLAAIALSRALDGSRRAWLVFGLALALGWLSHYRFAVFYLAGLAFLVGFPRGRALIRAPRFWGAQALGLLGFLPSLIFNLGNDWAALRFQYLERHPWSPHAAGLAEPLVQALVCTPLLAFALALGWREAARAYRAGRRDADLLLGLSFGLFAVYMVLGLVVDAERVRFHWPLPAYLLALPFVPAVLARWRAASSRSLRVLAAATPALGLATGLGFAVLLVAAPLRVAGLDLAWLTDNAVGWERVGAWARGHGLGRDGRLVIADNFMLGAELDFHLRPPVPPFVLDHPANRKHGRAAQLALWGRDEAGLRAATWRDGWLVVEESGRRPIDRLGHYRGLCARFARVEPVDELVLAEGRRPFVLFRVENGAARAGACGLPAFGYIDAPAPDAVVREATLQVDGWAIAEFVGIAAVDVLVDGAPRATATYGMPAPRVRAQWPESQDPRHPDVGFSTRLDLSGLAVGPHVLSLRLTDGTGRVREVARQRFRYAPE